MVRKLAESDAQHQIVDTVQSLWYTGSIMPKDHITRDEMTPGQRFFHTIGGIGENAKNRAWNHPNGLIGEGRRRAATALGFVAAAGLAGFAAHTALHSNTVNAGIVREAKQDGRPQPQAPTYPEGATPPHGDIPPELQTGSPHFPVSGAPETYDHPQSAQTSPPTPEQQHRGS